MSFDTILTIIGVVLIGFGLYIFLAGKASKDGAPSNKVEGFGIKVDVANPSILLIILGVGLVLVPRFFPDPNPSDNGVNIIDQAAEQEDDADLLVPQVETSQADDANAEALNQQDAVQSAENEPVQLRLAQQEAQEQIHVAAVAAPPVAAAVEPAAAVVAAPVTNAAKARPIPAKQPKTPLVVAKNEPSVAAEVQKPVEVAVAKPVTPVPVPAPQPPQPGLWVMVDADAEEYAGMKGMTAAEYSLALRERLAQLAAERFGKEYVTVEGAQPTVDGQKYKEVCTHSPAGRVLLATVRVPINDFSPIESSFWPHMVMVAVNCKDGRVHRSQPQRLTPQLKDKVFFEQDFLLQAQDFIARQAYFMERS